MVQSSLFEIFSIYQSTKTDQTKTYHMLRGRHGHDGMVAGLKKIQSVPITTKVVSSNHSKVCSIQHLIM